VTGMGVGKVQWQKPMVTVLIGLAPVIVSSVYFFGWRALAMLLLVNVAGYLTEYAFVRRQGQPVTSAAFITATLLTLSLPPTLPFWMAVVGVVFGMVFGKMVFGGFGRNVFNPALAGRVFIYVSFGGAMTTQWAEPVAGGLGGFAVWQSDAITQATPGILMKAGSTFPLSALFFGNTSGTLGGTSVLLVLAGGLYIVWKKAANYRIVVSGIVGFLAVQSVLWYYGIRNAPEPLSAIMAGSTLIGIFFYATDPVSASQTNEGRWIYGAYIGGMSSMIAVLSAWPAGTMFAILQANAFAPIMDVAIRALKKPAGKVT
jgi:Na+-transporting NADH:ubiquinone oxidoreductase subunit B